jgi:hypothetical protein
LPEARDHCYPSTLSSSSHPRNSDVPISKHPPHILNMRNSAAFIATLPLFLGASALAEWRQDCNSTITHTLPESTSIIIRPTSTWTGPQEKPTSQGHAQVFGGGNITTPGGHIGPNHGGGGSGSGPGPATTSSPHKATAGASSGKSAAIVVSSLMAFAGVYFLL